MTCTLRVELQLYDITIAKDLGRYFVFITTSLLLASVSLIESKMIKNRLSRVFQEK